jgi:hypothetical protein
MSAENEGAEVATQPDWAFLTNGRMPDGGPRYTETPADPYGPDAPRVAEPWNTVTAAFFIVIVLVWMWRLRGRYRRYPFLVCCMPILLAGGIGGTLYHATRVSRVYFLLDVIPISALGLAGAVFMAVRYWGGRGWWFVPGVAVFYAGVNLLLFRAVAPTSVQWSVNLSYASLAVVILTPIALVLWRTRFRYAGWVVAGIISFVIAWFFRLVDSRIGYTLPMGSHWLWHTFGAVATAFLIEFFYRVEGEAEGDSATEAVSPAVGNL